MFKDFKPVLSILVRFLAIYLAMIFLYQLYLNFYENQLVDPITYATAWAVDEFQKILGYQSVLHDLPGWHSILFLLDGQSTTRIVEGCNAVSVIILFIAFVLAFYQGKKTFVFLLISVLMILAVNVFRIAGLNIIYKDWPQYIKIGHDYVFPAIIYGLVVLLWLIWIKFFALKNENS
ncbi:MAG: exosortase family protein XrtF [Bacteroidetes bacterium]|nr:exosortase family protein XrtF [Bacteroidota bacterium]